jgi:hypothetical protein
MNYESDPFKEVSQEERTLMMAMALLGLPALFSAIAIMGLWMHFLPGYFGGP